MEKTLTNAWRATLFLFDRGASSPASEREVHTGDDPRIYCAICQAMITDRRTKVFRNDSFEHVFTNPAGYPYRIGCFQNAPGCLSRGERTDFFSWFSGYAWTFALCKTCLSHLGWHYYRQHDDFFGLILDRLK